MTPSPCRSELAREEPENAASIQNARVIVDDLREQARSYRPPVALKPTPSTVSTDNGSSKVSSTALAGRSTPG